MAVLLIRLAGPMQAWGDSSRFARRTTRHEPTKSGIVGLIASALGRSREDSIDDLAQLELAIRTEQPGNVIRDFQTERPMDGGKAMPLSHRYYLSDACFLAALGGPNAKLEQISSALKLPKRPLYLGRRSCPVDMPVSVGIVSETSDVRLVLNSEPWKASEYYKLHHNRVDSLEIVADARDGEICESWADYPLTYSVTGRRYACRAVTRYRIPNPDFKTSETDEVELSNDSRLHKMQAAPDHDPLEWME